MTATGTTTTPTEAEASGQESVTASYNGQDYTLPLDADSWPLQLISRTVHVNELDRIFLRRRTVSDALEKLLGDQWDGFAAQARRRDIVAASQAFATAIGFAPTAASDVAFGSLPRLLQLIDRWPAKVESDLDRFWGIDYGDRWRFDDNGRRVLTLRRIHTRLSNLPVNSALAIALNGGRQELSDAALVLMDIFEHTFKKAHPSRPLTREQLIARRTEVARAEEAKAKHLARRRKNRNRDDMKQIARRNAAQPA